MKIDKIALIFACIAFGVWLLAILGGILASGLVGIVALVVLAAGGYLLGVVVSQRLNSREDDYYDEIER